MSSTSASRRIVDARRLRIVRPAAAASVSLRAPRSDAVGQRRGEGRLFALLDMSAPGRVPRRDLVAPPELAGHAPGLDVLEPIEIGLLPVLRDELGLAVAHRGERGLSERLGVDVPLVGQPRLDDRHSSGRRAGPCGRAARFSGAGPRRHHRDDALARVEAIEAIERRPPVPSVRGRSPRRPRRRRCCLERDAPLAVRR